MQRIFLYCPHLRPGMAGLMSWAAFCTASTPTMLSRRICVLPTRLLDEVNVG